MGRSEGIRVSSRTNETIDGLNSDDMAPKLLFKNPRVPSNSDICIILPCIPKCWLSIRMQKYQIQTSKEGVQYSRTGDRKSKEQAPTACISRCTRKLVAE